VTRALPQQFAKRIEHRVAVNLIRFTYIRSVSAFGLYTKKSQANDGDQLALPYLIEIITMPSEADIAGKL
jgi:hypothetical protein